MRASASRGPVVHTSETSSTLIISNGPSVVSKRYLSDHAAYTPPANVCYPDYSSSSVTGPVKRPLWVDPGITCQISLANTYQLESFWQLTQKAPYIYPIPRGSINLLGSPHSRSRNVTVSFNFISSVHGGSGPRYLTRWLCQVGYPL